MATGGLHLRVRVGRITERDALTITVPVDIDRVAVPLFLVIIVLQEPDRAQVIWGAHRGSDREAGLASVRGAATEDRWFVPEPG